VILFSPGTDAVSPEALPTIAQIADVLRGIPNDVRLIGYADATPIHNRRFGSNWELSMARSHKILELLSNRYGIPESRLSIASYGPNRPAAPNDTVDGRAYNRRVEIVILDESMLEGE
jgi:chemotaxis protein MotB